MALRESLLVMRSRIPAGGRAMGQWPNLTWIRNYGMCIYLEKHFVLRPCAAVRKIDDLDTTQGSTAIVDWYHESDHVFVRSINSLVEISIVLSPPT